MQITFIAKQASKIKRFAPLRSKCGFKFPFTTRSVSLQIHAQQHFLQQHRLMMCGNQIRNLHLHPLVKNCFAGGVAWGLGNYFCQRSTETHISVKSIYVAAVFGAIISTPLSFVWHNLLRGGLALIPRSFSNSPNRMKLAFSQVFLTSLILSPTLLSCLIIWNNMNSSSSSSILQEVCNSLPPLLFASYSFWPFMNIMNFMFIPQHARVVAALIQMVLWSGICSHMDTQK